MEGGSIGPYRIVRKLGEGGMGTVWLGEHTLLGRRAAIKVLLPEYSRNASIVQRFFNEARAVTVIADPGIVQVFDFGQADGSAYIIMELLEGEAMDMRLKRIGRFMPADAIRLMAQIATSLGAAHAKGVIHRDLKPENIFIVGDPAVTGGERTKILDFGIAKLIGDDNGMHKTSTGLVMGTPVYMSPEQCRGASAIDARSDIYTLGCVLFTMLCGRPPFEAEGSGDLIVMHLRDTPPAPSSVIPGLTREIDGLVLRCLEKDPNRRFQNTRDMVVGLAVVEASLYGIGEDAFMQSMQTPAMGGAGYVSSPGTGPVRRSLTPAAAMAYRQQPTPAPHDAHTRMATGPNLPGYTTGSPAPQPHLQSQPQVQPQPHLQPSRRKVGLIAVVAAVLVIAAGVIAFVALGGDRTTEAASASPADAAGSSAVAAPDAAPAVVVTPPDAPAVVVTPPDAAPAVAETPPDAATVVTTETVDAGVVAVDRDKTRTNTKRGGKRDGTKRGGSNATSTSGSGTVDRGD